MDLRLCRFAPYQKSISPLKHPRNSQLDVCERRMGHFKKIPVIADYNQLIYDQTVLGMDYLDCSNQTLSLIDFKIQDHSGDIVNLCMTTM